MTPALSTAARSRRERRLSPAAVALLQQFPPRPAAITWPTTQQPQEGILDRLLQAPFVLKKESTQSKRRVGLRKILAWLEQHPGDTWQDRWIASGADAAGNIAWRELAMTWLQATGWAYRTPNNDFHALGAGLLPLISGDVIRPSLSWLLTPDTVQMLTAEMARSRDPDGFTALAALCQDDPANYHTKDGALRRIATLIAAKGGRVRDIIVGDCVELAALLPTAGSGSADTSAYYYQLLHALGIFPATAPPSVRFFTGKTRGQVSIEQMIDQYQLSHRPIRDLLVEGGSRNTGERHRDPEFPLVSGVGEVGRGVR